jgi:hypothetical protein
MNYQTAMLGKLTLQNVGIMEALPAFLEDIGISPDIAIPHRNQAALEPLPELGSTALRQFELANAADYELYESARDRWL